MRQGLAPVFEVVVFFEKAAVADALADATGETGQPAGAAAADARADATGKGTGDSRPPRPRPLAAATPRRLTP